MSIHRSLQVKTKMKRHRNVLKREERLELLGKQGKWKENETIFGLPKTKGEKQIKKVKKDKKKEEAAAAAPAAAPAAAAKAPAAKAPAAGAAKQEKKK